MRARFRRACWLAHVDMATCEKATLLGSRSSGGCYRATSLRLRHAQALNCGNVSFLVMAGQNPALGVELQAAMYQFRRLCREDATISSGYADAIEDYLTHPDTGLVRVTQLLDLTEHDLRNEAKIPQLAARRAVTFFSCVVGQQPVSTPPATCVSTTCTPRGSHRCIRALHCLGHPSQGHSLYVHAPRVAR